MRLFYCCRPVDVVPRLCLTRLDARFCSNRLKLEFSKVELAAVNRLCAGSSVNKPNGGLIVTERLAANSRLDLLMRSGYNPLILFKTLPEGEARRRFSEQS